MGAAHRRASCVPPLMPGSTTPPSIEPFDEVAALRHQVCELGAQVCSKPPTERPPRVVVVVRKNFLFAGSEAGGGDVQPDRSAVALEFRSHQKPSQSRLTQAPSFPQALNPQTGGSAAIADGTLLNPTRDLAPDSRARVDPPCEAASRDSMHHGLERRSSARIRDRRRALRHPDPEFDRGDPPRFEQRIQLKTALGGVRSFTYLYDFGDH